MQRLFSGEVYEMVPQGSGIVFSYCKNASENRVLVSYKMVNLETGLINDVAKNIYLLSKFGSNYRASCELCSNYVTVRSIVLPSGKVFLSSDNGKAYLIDDDGLPVWSGELNYKGELPSDVAIHKSSLWACYKNEKAMLRYNLNTMREELRIGGTNSPLDRPCDIFIDGDVAIISNVGSNKLLRLDLKSYAVSDYKEFTEPVYGYVKVKNAEFVLLKSGIYMI